MPRISLTVLETATIIQTLKGESLSFTEQVTVPAVLRKLEVALFKETGASLSQQVKEPIPEALVALLPSNSNPAQLQEAWRKTKAQFPKYPSGDELVDQMAGEFFVSNYSGI